MRGALVIVLVALAGCGTEGEASLDAAPDSILDASVEDATAADADAASDADLPTPDVPLPPDAVDHDPDPEVVHVRLRAAPREFVVRGETVSGFAYNEVNPAPTIRARRGSRVIIDVDNQLEAPTTIHWHGLHVPFDMDGVVWMGAPIGAGETFRYEFVVSQQAGTYWYHPHFDTERQVDLGLYGAFVIEDPVEPASDLDAVVFFDSWGEAPGTSGHTGHRDGTHLTWTANNVAEGALRVAAGSVVRLRLLNASNAGYLNISGQGMRAIGASQGLLPADREWRERELLVPGDRRDFEVRVGSEAVEIRTAPHTLHGGAGHGDERVLFRIEPTGEAELPSGLDWPSPEIRPSVDPSYTDILYSFQGDTDLERWFINGERFPDVTIEEVPLDSVQIIELRNVSPAEHPFHMHGHGFEILSINDVPVSTYSFVDTFNLPVRSRVRIRLIADNPGDWMTHCHILPHAYDGMMTVLRVLAASP